MINFRKTLFKCSCPAYKNLPEDNNLEVAFAGRSNVGKSSVINSLTGNRKLAKSSSVPGKTREINLFTINDKARLVDLPGYGYAKVSKKEQARWALEMTRYIKERPNLKGIMILMDMRHPLTPLDLDMINLVRDTGKAYAFILNKADKLSKNNRINAFRTVEKELLSLGIPALLIPYSAEKNLGLKELGDLLSGWIEAR